MSANLNFERDGDPGDVDGLDVTGLVTRARDGQERAWNALVERYSPLIWSICRRYRLDGAHAEDVSQMVWLRLVDHLGGIRDPAALPGWLITTTRRECGRVLSTARTPYHAGYAPGAEDMYDDQAVTAEQQVLAAERNAALREAFARLPPCCQRLLAMLSDDPPVPYAEISAKLGIAIGSIGPSRGRCLGKLRRYLADTTLITS